MASKIAIANLFAVLAWGSLSAQDIRERYTPTEYLINYALSTCLADGYTSEEVRTDSSAAARGYLELGSFPLEAYTEATLLGRKFLQKDYKSISGESLTLMKCIDFIHSRELKQLAAKYRRNH